jgi:hypothetical protein
LKKFLVACPNYEGKEYSFQRWIDNVRAFTYPNYDILVVDNSDTPDFYERWKNQVPMIHALIEGGSYQKIAKSMEIIRQRFIDGGYDYWLNLESDIIPPTDIIESLLLLGNDADWINHSYPERLVNAQQIGIGCSIFSRHLMQDISLEGAGENGCISAWLREFVRQQTPNKVVELWSMLKLEHLCE